MRLVLAVALAAAAAPATAGVYELFPTNKRSADGSYRPVLEVWRDRRGIIELRADRGEIAPRAVADGPAAIAAVVQHFRLSPQRDRVVFCPNGFAGVACHWPTDRDDDAPWSVGRIHTWP